jgi:hypothetical protein
LHLACEYIQRAGRQAAASERGVGACAAWYRQMSPRQGCEASIRH